MNNECGFVSCFKQLLSSAEESKMAELKKEELLLMKNPHISAKSWGNGKLPFLVYRVI